MEKRRVHVVVGGFPLGSHAGHDMEYARLQLLTQLWERSDVFASVASDFSDLQRWLPGAQMLISYVAGPYPDDEQNQVLRDWLEAGGRWLAMHGTAGGRAARTEKGQPRRMVKASHHETLGGFFLNHPPTRRFKVDVADAEHPLTRGLPASFEVVDEPYMVELQAPQATRVLLTAELGPDTSPPGFGFRYDEDTALLPDGKTRVLAYTYDLGKGRRDLHRARTLPLAPEQQPHDGGHQRRPGGRVACGPARALGDRRLPAVPTQRDRLGRRLHRGLADSRPRARRLPRADTRPPVKDTATKQGAHARRRPRPRPSAAPRHG